MGTLDPESPLAPLPDIGVDWPDISEAEPVAPDAVTETPAQAATSDVETERRYQVKLEGLEAVEDKEQLRTRFDALSALVEGEDKSANVAQIDRRARQDEALMRELLRAHGHYDATVTARVDPPENGQIVVALQIEPGPLYHFTNIELRGVDQAGPKADALRAAFGVKPDDPIDADVVTAGTTRLRIALLQSWANLKSRSTMTAAPRRWCWMSPPMARSVLARLNCAASGCSA
jgi:translocation and assembly module TamA